MERLEGEFVLLAAGDVVVDPDHSRARVVVDDPPTGPDPDPASVLVLEPKLRLEQVVVLDRLGDFVFDASHVIRMDTLCERVERPPERPRFESEQPLVGLVPDDLAGV